MSRSRRGRGRRWWGVGVAAAIATTLYLALRPVPVEVELAAVGRGPLQVAVEEEAIARVRDRFVVAAPITGRLARLALRPGDEVAAGDVLARIAPAPADARAEAEARARVAAAASRLAGARSALVPARQALDQARRDLERRRSLRDAGALSPADYEAASLLATSRARDYEAATAEARGAAAELDAARATLLGLSAAAPAPTSGAAGRTLVAVRAPAAGRVLRVFEESERILPAGTPVLEVGDPGSLELVIEVLTTDAVAICAGAPVLLDDWGGAGTLRGRVLRVEPSAFTKVSALGVEEHRVRVIADVADAPAALGDGFHAVARIVTWQAPSVLTVPATALFRQGAEWRVFTAESGRTRGRRVTIGHRGGERVEVLSGLRAGERVVLFPSDRIAEGTRIRSR
ncbi:MAG TPA: HlyD family efflux transporter periplasmic adaptor subunit [Longimicrobiales bacterium]|nr:HlyD family efflux transporter periplasmic adaptor subunit [Longimicrobiales bacterium]